MAILIGSVISIAMFEINSGAFEIYESKKLSNDVNQEFLSTKLLLQNRLINSKIISIDSQKVEFYELDHYAIEQKIVSGFAELDSNMTSKKRLKTECLPYLPAYNICVGFEDGCYDVASVESDLITFDDKISPKKMSENYFFYTKASISCGSDSLKYLDEVLLDKLSSCKISKKSNILEFELCKNFDDKKICKTLKISI